VVKGLLVFPKSVRDAGQAKGRRPYPVVGLPAHFGPTRHAGDESQWRAGVKELQRLLVATATLGARPWYISRAGFTPEAETFEA
jgi:hypothetical protein